VARLPGALTLREDDRRVLAAWAADCTERALASRSRPHDCTSSAPAAAGWAAVFADLTSLLETGSR
jgi:hypothetical protein